MLLLWISRPLVFPRGGPGCGSRSGCWCGDLFGLDFAKGEAKKAAITVAITGEGAGKLVTNVARITHQDRWAMT